MAAAAKWVMITIGGMAGGLRILWEVLRHPLTAFKKTPRDGGFGRRGLISVTVFMSHIREQSA